MHGLQCVIYHFHNLLQMESSGIQLLFKQTELLHKLYYYCVQEYSRNMSYFVLLHHSVLIELNVLEAQVVNNQMHYQWQSM